MFESYNQYELIWSKTIQPRTGDVLGEKTVVSFLVTDSVSINRGQDYSDSGTPDQGGIFCPLKN